MLRTVQSACVYDQRDPGVIRWRKGILWAPSRLGRHRLVGGGDGTTLSRWLSFLGGSSLGTCAWAIHPAQWWKPCACEKWDSSPPYQAFQNARCSWHPCGKRRRVGLYIRCAVEMSWEHPSDGGSTAMEKHTEVSLRNLDNSLNVLGSLSWGSGPTLKIWVMLCMTGIQRKTDKWIIEGKKQKQCYTYMTCSAEPPPPKSVCSVIHWTPRLGVRCWSCLQIWGPLIRMNWFNFNKRGVLNTSLIKI